MPEGEVCGFALHLGLRPWGVLPVCGLRFCFAFGTAPVGYAPHVRYAPLLSSTLPAASGTPMPEGEVPPGCSPAVSIAAGGLWRSLLQRRASFCSPEVRLNRVSGAWMYESMTGA